MIGPDRDGLCVASIPAGTISAASPEGEDRHAGDDNERECDQQEPRRLRRR